MKRKIAVYGKGGIGKSTISANLSAAFAKSGRSVLQIGCDPKHDSTRFLLHGQLPETVLDYLRRTRPQDYRLHDILAEGYLGIGCVEAGGPEPGVGCAGRGIISTFELLDLFHLRDRYDITIYDVLGDVVCGGFAVPIRREYADTILIVTSGEFMSLYAANNILKGIANYDGSRRRIAGLVFNRRNVEGESDRVFRFADAVRLPVFAEIPRSDSFARAERQNATVMELREDSALCRIFTGMASRLNDNVPLFAAHPLSDDALEKTVLENAAHVFGISRQTDPDHDHTELNPHRLENPSASDANGSETISQNQDTSSEIYLKGSENRPGLPDEPDLRDFGRYRSKNLYPGSALQGCAFNGAVNTLSQLKDAVILAHSPKSCIFIAYQGISSGGRRTLFERGTLLPASLIPDLSCTEMGQSEIVFGGMDCLRIKIRQLIRENQDLPEERKAHAIIVVSSCPSGIIGDDIDETVSLSTDNLPVIPVRTDGNMAGDFMQGVFMSSMAAASALIQKDIPVQPDMVNILGEKASVSNTDSNFKTIQNYLNRMGLHVGCRFLCDCSVAQLSQWNAASLTLPAFGDYTTKTLAAFFQNKYHTRMMDMAFPVGFDETCAWLRKLGRLFGRETEAEEIIREASVSYLREIRNLEPALRSKKLMIITYNHELDWILKPALDLNMKIVKIGVLSFSQDEGFRTRIEANLPVEENYVPEKKEEDLRKYHPDILITNYASQTEEPVQAADTIPMCPDVGFSSGIRLARRWARLLKSNLKGDWKKDEFLFKQYYS